MENLEIHLRILALIAPPWLLIAQTSLKLSVQISPFHHLAILLSILCLFRLFWWKGDENLRIHCARAQRNSLHLTPKLTSDDLQPT